jgi:hypothetical protein
MNMSALMNMSIQPDLKGNSMKSAMHVFAALVLVLGSGAAPQAVFAQKQAPVKIPNGVDPLTAEVQGIHLNMTFDEVAAVLTPRLRQGHRENYLQLPG